MIYNKKIWAVLVSCIICASCNKSDEPEMPIIDETENVSFTASMKTVSRATETEFEEKDEIVVYAVQEDEYKNTALKSSGNYADHVRYTYAGGKFTNAKGIIRPTDFGVRYFAVYPYSAVTGVPAFKFNVKTNQNVAGQYTLSDLCTAVSNVTFAKDVNLVFSHRLSHVVVNLDGESLGTDNVEVRLNDVHTGCDVNLNNNTFVAYESKSTVYCADNGTNSHKAIIAPQTIKKDSPFLTAVLNGKEYVLKATSDIQFTSGKQQVFNLTVKNDEIVSYTSSILPWGENEEVENQEGNVDIYIAGMYDGLYDGYVPCVWLNGEMHTLGRGNYDEAGVYGCAYSMAVSENNVYVVGHQTSPFGSETDTYRENATIWKNGAILYEGIDKGLSTTEDILVSGNDVWTVGLGESGSPYIRKNGEISWLPIRMTNESNWAQSIAESNGNIYVMGRNVTALNNIYGTNKTFFWKNQELMDYEIDGDGLCMSVQDDIIYCLVEKTDGMLYLWKNGQLTATGLKYSDFGIVGPNFKTMFVNEEDVYILGHQDGIAKIWKNGEISLLSTDDNNYCLSGIYVYNDDVYVIGYEVMYYEYPQYSNVKLWKNGEETILPSGGWITYPCSIVVTPTDN